MKKFLFFLILLCTTKLYGQTTFYTSGQNVIEPLQEPESSENSINVIILIKAKTQPDSIFKDVLIVEGIGVKLYYKDGQKEFSINRVSFSNEAADNYLKLTFKITSNELGINDFNFGTDWSDIRVNLNATLSGSKINSSGAVFKNGGYTEGRKPRVTKFFKLTSNANSRILISGEIPLYNITTVKIKSKEGTVLGAAKPSDILRKDDKTFEINVEPGVGYSFIFGEYYTIEFTYSVRNTNATVVYKEQKLEGIEEFKVIGIIEGNSVYDHNSNTLKVQTSTEPKELWLEIHMLNGTILKIKGDKIDAITTQFSIPSDKAEFGFGRHSLTFSGTANLTGSELNTSDGKYFFDKKKPIVLQVKPIYKDGKFTVIAECDGVLKDKKGVFLEIEGKKFSMDSEDGKTFSLAFGLRDILLNRVIEKGKKEITISVVYPTSECSSTSISYPIAVIDNDALEAIAKTNKKRKEKKTEIADYLKKNDFEGDVKKVADTIVDEFSKEKNNRDWDKVWSGMVKLAPKIIGALILLL